MKYLEQHGALLLKTKPRKTLNIVMEALQRFKPAERTPKNLYRVFDVFRNLDEIYKYEETKTIVEYLTKQLSSFEESRAEIGTFIINYYVFKLKNNDAVDESASEYIAQVDRLLDNESIMRVLDHSYLLNLFTHMDMREQRIRVLQVMGKRSEVLKLHFNEKRYDEAYRYCAKYAKDPDLSVLLLQLIFNLIVFENGEGAITISSFWESVIRGAFLLVVVLLQVRLVRRRGATGRAA